MKNFVIVTETTKSSVIIGFDVHKATLSACVLDPQTKQVLLERTFANRADRLKAFIKRLGTQVQHIQACYEASSCGFALYRQLTALSVPCEVIAPSSIPRRSGDRVKNDCIDARKLATFYANGLLQSVTIPDTELEALRGLIRCRQAMVEDLTRTRQRVTSFLLARGLHFREGKHWSQAFDAWLKRLSLVPDDRYTLEAHRAQIDYLTAQIRAIEQQIEPKADEPRYRDSVRALSAFRGIALLSALTLVAELGDIRRFESPRQLMAYLGLVPQEHSSGGRTRRGAITKAGNKYARKTIVSAAWKYTNKPARSKALMKRQAMLAPDRAPRVLAISAKAQQRLYKRFHTLSPRKPRSVANVAVARELAGFLWAALQ